MTKPDDLKSLSDRENQILQLAVFGHTDQAIANRLGISVATVSTYWTRIRQKAGFLSRSELVAQYVQLNAEEQLDELRAENMRLVDSMDELVHGQFFQALQALIDTNEESILIVDDTGVIAMSNPPANEVFRATAGELTGRNVLDFVPDGYRDSHSAQRAAYMEAPDHRKIGEHRALPAIRCNGELFAFTASLNVFKAGPKKFVTCVLRELPVALVLPRYGAGVTEGE